MARALQLAANGRGQTSPNPMVGCVIVARGRIIGEGWHRRYGGPHAEVNAVNSVSDRSLLPEATVYVTLEPCSHYGKTPPCADMLVACGVKRVVVGCTDPNPRVSGRGLARLRDAGIEVETGVLEEECRRLNRRFFTAQTLHRPYVMLKWACSSDGFLDVCRDAGESAPHFSTPLTLMAMHRLRGCFDAILAGSTTVENDNPRLDTRLLPGRDPRRVIVARRGLISSEANIFKGPAPLYYSTHPAPSENAEYVECSPEFGVAELLADLFGRGITSLMVEGGPTLLKSFIESGLWDDARIEISPVILGTRGRCRMSVPEGIKRFSSLDGNTIVHVSNH